MKRGPRLPSVLACCAALLFGALSPPPCPARARGAEGLIEARFPPEGRDQVARAYRAAVKAGMRERQAADLLEACLDGEFEAGQTARVLTLAAQLSLEGLPTESFAAKIAEGVAKGAPADRVVQVAERRAQLLNRARLILNGLLLEGLDVDGREDLLQDVAEAMEAGRSPEEARGILAEALREGERIGEIRRKLFP